MPQISNKTVGNTGFGLMGFTWRPETCPQPQAIATMKAAVNRGATFWDGGEIYGTPERNSLHLLNEYFTQYPEDADKVVLSIKGGVDLKTLAPQGDAEGVRRSVDECVRVLDGKKFLDTFECARVDPKTPIEETMRVLGECVKEGKIGGISLSEVGAETIRRAAKVHKIDTVEVEFSLHSTNLLTNGVAAACAEFGIPIIGYSPLGRGFLTGSIKKREDLNPPSLRDYPRFTEANFANNLKLVDEVKAVADKKGCTAGQVALAWCRSYSGKKGMPVILPIPGGTTEARVQENTTEVTLSDAELKEIEQVLAKCEIKGDRYGGHLASLMNG